MAKVIHLDIWDYVVCGVVLFLTSLLGMYHVIAARRAKDARAFLVSNSDIGYVPIIMSLIATYVSAIGVLGFPVDAYSYGILFSSMALCALIIIPIGLFIFLPIYCDVRVNSLFEILYSSIAIYAPALALNQATGLHTWLSIALIGVICVVYTSLGGIKAVIWADATQLLVMILILVMVVVKGVMNLGGVEEIYRLNKESGRLDTNRSDLPYTFWLVLIAYPFHQIGSTFANQSMVQRYLSKQTFKQNAFLFVGGTVGVAFVQFFMTSSGFLVTAKYYGCDPLYNKEITSRDQMLVLFSMDTLSFCKGLPGLFIAGILCASLSTLSSTLNSLATVTIEDYILPFKPNIRSTTLIKLSKIIAVVYGLLCILFVLVIQNLGGIIQVVFCLTGMMQGPVVAVLLIGMLFPWIDSKAVSIGFLATISFTTWAAIGSMVNKVQFNHLPYRTDMCEGNSTQLLFNSTFDNYPLKSHSMVEFSTDQNLANQPFALYTLNSIWYTLCSVGIMFVISPLHTFLFGSTQKIDEMDPRIIAKCSRSLIGKLPTKWKVKMGFTDQIDHLVWFGEEPKELKNVKVMEASQKPNGVYQPIIQTDTSEVRETEG
ncbi:hypothetical protein CHUAL_008031 [Chamberlinius hualienensis]